MSLQPTLVEVLNDAVDRKLTDVHVAVPATVVLYNRITQRVTVQPAVKQPRFNDDGKLVYYAFPPIKNVPVAWPRVGQAAMHGDLEPGDSVELLFHSQGIGEWRQGTQGAEPKDLRRHSFGYPVARPGLYPDTQPLQNPGEGFSIGYQGLAHVGKILFGESFVQIGEGAGLPLATATTIGALVTAISTALGTVDTTAGSASKATFDSATGALGYTTIAKGV